MIRLNTLIIDCDLWKLNRVVERLSIFDDLEKLLYIAYRVIFLVFEVEVMT